jgi:hypothetical protein
MWVRTFARGQSLHSRGDLQQSSDLRASGNPLCDDESRLNRRVFNINRVQIENI